MGDSEVAQDRRVMFDTNGESPVLSPSTTASLKKKSSLKLSSGKKREAGTSVSFMETVTVRHLPSEEADEAQDTRKGPWEAAPEHDELWDGDRKDFWEKEKTLEEVHRIVVMRQMRMALQYNLGYAFYSMVANFKKRRPAAEPDPLRPQRSNSDDVIPQFETPGAEETAIRKEIRELFNDSVKGLDFPDLVKDREAFEKIYGSTVLNISEMKRVPGLGLLRIEELVDEIMNSEAMCKELGVQYIPATTPEKDPKQLETLEKIETEVGKEERRRGERRASVEAMSGHSVFGERRASIEGKRRTSIEPLGHPPAISLNSCNDGDDDQPIFQSSGRVAANPRPISPAAPTVTVAPTPTGAEPSRRPSLTTTGAPEVRRASLTTPSPAVTGEVRRPSINAPPSTEARRPSLTSAQEGRRPSVTTGSASSQVETPRSASGSMQAAVSNAENPAGKSGSIGHLLTLLFGFALLLLSALLRSFTTSSAKDVGGNSGSTSIKGSGVLGWFVPLLIIFGVAMMWK